jgi:hypothetical protein
MADLQMEHHEAQKNTRIGLPWNASKERVSPSEDSREKGGAINPRCGAERAESAWAAGNKTGVINTHPKLRSVSATLKKMNCFLFKDDLNVDKLIHVPNC